jgi:hypothetical protein
LFVNNDKQLNSARGQFSTCTRIVARRSQLFFFVTGDDGMLPSARAASN